MTKDNTTPDISLHEIEAELEKLRREFLDTPPPEHGYGNTDNLRSPRAVLSNNLVDSFSCTYCTSCTHCVKCTHCVDCKHLYDSRYCVQSERCSGCSYVIMSTDCHDCVFCFGCVGLVNKEFHILNKKYPRNKYFQLLEAIKKHFGVNV